MDLLYQYFRILTSQDSTKKKTLKSVIENTANFGIVALLTPAVYLYEILIVLPLVTEKWSVTYFIHIATATFMLINVLGNMLYGIFTDTSIRASCLPKTLVNHDWPTCTVCQCLRPPRAWHCDDCNVCILTRDHHCSFWACCIGYFNRRYFILFTFHIFLALAYSSYFNIAFLLQLLTWNYSLIGKFSCPMLYLCLYRDVETVYVLVIVLNALIAVMTGSLFFYHFYNILNGKIVPDAKYYPNCSYSQGWKKNLLEVLGSRWYITWIFPFVNSPLPGNGLEYTEKGKQK